jgi:ABC-type spermidine/putrescine transport system permease subunit II
LGAPPRSTIRYIILPLIWPAVLAAGLISVTLSVDEFIITFFTVGPQTTLPLYIYTQIKFGVTPEVNAVATMFLAVMLGLLAVGLLFVAARRRLGEKGRG